MNRTTRTLVLLAAVACTGQNRVLQEDKERGVLLRYQNVESIGCFGDAAGIGGAMGAYSLELSRPRHRSFSIDIPGACDGPPSFDASTTPIRITCNDETYALYTLGDGPRGTLGPPGEFRPLAQVADRLVDVHGRRILQTLLTEAYHRGQMVEVLTTLGDTDCGEWWGLSFDALSTTDQKRVRAGLRARPEESAIRTERLQ